MKITVWYDERAARAQTRTAKPWAVTVYGGGRSETTRYETEEQADFAAARRTTYAVLRKRAATAAYRADLRSPRNGGEQR